MTVLLGLLALVVIAVGAIAFSIMSSPSNRRACAVWLISTAQAKEERRAAYWSIEVERRKRENEMRMRYGLPSISQLREDRQEVAPWRGR